MALDADVVVLTVATDGASMYLSEIASATATHSAGEFSEIEAAKTLGQYLLGAGIDDVSELGRFDRERIFNLGYYTRVEQQVTGPCAVRPAMRPGILGRTDGFRAGLGRHDRRPERRHQLSRSRSRSLLSRMVFSPKAGEGDCERISGAGYRKGGPAQ